MTTTDSQGSAPDARLFRILVLPGDGIGREVIPAALEVLRWAETPRARRTR